MCPFIRPSVCPSHAGIVSKRLNAGSRKQRRTRFIADAKDLGKIPMGSPLTEGRLQSAIFDQYLAIAETMQDRDIVTMER